METNETIKNSMSRCLQKMNAFCELLGALSESPYSVDDAVILLPGIANEIQRDMKEASAKALVALEQSTSL